MKKAYIFPGQGGQCVGMGAGLPSAAFDEVDRALGIDLSEIIFNGPEEELNKAVNLQPAIFAASMAMWMKGASVSAGVPVASTSVDTDVSGILNINVAASAVSGAADINAPVASATKVAAGASMHASVASAAKAAADALKNTAEAASAVPDVSFVAGHSLGEYAALCAAGAAKIGDIARLLRRRGELMQSVGEGSMAAIIGDVDAVAVCIEAGCEPANDNGGGQWVVSGSVSSVEKAMEIAKERGAKIVKKLAVNIAAHSSLMLSISDQFRAAIGEVEWKAPVIPFVSNRSAEVMEDVREIKESLVYQLTHGVRWRESILYLRGLGVSEFVEVGPGSVLTGLCRRILPESNCYKLEA
ncbi:MAG: ACP S-malonyltransferase [Rickettsiales bacterium]|jgi:[acyl-carrier-protein] S-malonyltransferase|nr:ACP S-malonyltransferase [Rickettsiales bacterium]